MNQKVQDENYYKKILLLDKLNKNLTYMDKRDIFMKGYCWDIILKSSIAYPLVYEYFLLALGHQKEILNKTNIVYLKKYLETNAYLSYFYACYISNSRLPKSEDALSKEPFYAYQYAKYVLKHRFKKAESAILASEHAVDYIIHVVKEPWPNKSEIHFQDKGDLTRYNMFIVSFYIKRILRLT